MYINLSEEKLEELEVDLFNYIDSLSVNRQSVIWNDYCNAYGWQDDIVYDCDEFTVDDLCEGLSPSKIIERYGDIDFSWSYMQFTIYGAEEWCGCDDYEIKEMIDYIIDRWDDLENGDICDILEEYEEYDEDEE